MENINSILEYNFDITDQIKSIVKKYVETGIAEKYINSAILKFDVTSMNNLNRGLIDKKILDIVANITSNKYNIDLDKYNCYLLIEFCNHDWLYMSTGKFPYCYINSIHKMVEKCKVDKCKKVKCKRIYQHMKT